MESARRRGTAAMSAEMLARRWREYFDISILAALRQS